MIPSTPYQFDKEKKQYVLSEGYDYHEAVEDINAQLDDAATWGNWTEYRALYEVLDDLESEQ